MEKLRIDKWLWAARFYKTRSLATEEVNKGRVQIAGQDVKPAREVKPGDLLTLRQGPVVRTLMAPDRYGGKFRLQVLVCDFDGQKMAEADSTLFPPT